MVTLGNRDFGLHTCKALQCSLLRWMDAAHGNMFITLYSVPAKNKEYIKQVMKKEFNRYCFSWQQGEITAQITFF